MTYARNNATTRPILLGKVVKISDGSLETTSVSIEVSKDGGAWSAGTGTASVNRGEWSYLPSQGETDCETLRVVAYKTDYYSASAQVVFSASSSFGHIGTDQSKIANPTSIVNLSNTTIKTATDVEGKLPSDHTSTVIISSNEVNAKYGRILVSSGSALQITGNEVNVQAESLVCNSVTGIALLIEGNNTNVKTNYISGGLLIKGDNTNVKTNYINGGIGFDSDSLESTVSADYINGSIVFGTSCKGGIVINAKSYNSFGSLAEGSPNNPIYLVFNIDRIFIDPIGDGLLLLDNCTCDIESFYISAGSLTCSVPNTTFRFYNATIDIPTIDCSDGVIEFYNCVILGNVTQSSTGVIRYDALTKFRGTVTGTTTPMSLAANTLTASALATDAVSEIQSGLALQSTVLGVKTKTDNLPNDPADASDIAASFAVVNGSLAIIAGYIDTEIVAIKAKTDNLPPDPADASDIAASFATVNGSLSIIAGYIDTEITAIKAKTDLIPADIGSVLVSVNGNRTVFVTGAHHVAADIHELQPAVIETTHFAANAINANALATDAVTEIANGVATIQVLSRLDSMIESNGGGQFRFDTIALSLAPSGGGGGGGTIIVSPLSAIGIDRVSGTTIRLFTEEQISHSVDIYDADNNPVNLSAMTLQLDIATEGRQLLMSTTNITVSGPSSNKITFTNNLLSSAKAGVNYWALRNTASGNRIIAHGLWIVNKTAKVGP